MKQLFVKVAGKINGISIMTLSIGIVYLWFGLLKFFPHLSPAEDLAKNTIHQLTFGYIPANISIILLAIWETGIGLLLILNIYKRVAIVLALVHMACTFTPLIFFPDISFKSLPFTFTLIGQYIAKNIVIVSALILILIDNNTSHGEKLGH